MNQINKQYFYRILFPSVIELVFNQLFSLVDNIMVGHIPDSTVAVAAVSLCQSPINLVICVMNAFFIGTTAVVAWHFGAREEDKMQETAQQSLMLAAISGFAVSALAFIFSPQIMGFVCGKSETLETAVAYYKINSVGFFFQICSMCVTAAFRGRGITSIPMAYNIISNAANAALNYILIYGKLGFQPMYVRGAAIATVISKIILFIISLLFFVFYKKGFPLQRGKISLRLAYQVRHRMLKIGLTSACEQLILQSGATLTAKIISVLPTKQIAALQITSNLESLAWSSGDACCTASTSLFGKSLGEGREDRAKAYFRLSEVWALIFSALEIIIFCFGGKIICSLFTNDTSIYGDIILLLKIAAVGLPFINTHKTVSGALRGAGDSTAPLISSLLSLWIFRVLLGYILISVLNMGASAYRWCLNADQFVRMAAMLAFYLGNHWKKYAQAEMKNTSKGASAI